MVVQATKERYTMGSDLVGTSSEDARGDGDGDGLFSSRLIEAFRCESVS